MARVLFTAPPQGAPCCTLRPTLRSVSLDGTGDRQLTLGDVVYIEPDTHASGALLGEPRPQSL